ncbi:hypothetical protein [Microvirga soli]|jgi:hypothetical protein|uniref:hypothetical protein n=1 Tax=Microvirga soli TaxID=1854496 RepID=UPI00191F7D4B|nr:hypothetical protein [Microvirga soli]
MNTTDLQNRLARLVSGETLLVLAAEIEQAFDFYPSPEQRREAAGDLAALYQRSILFCGPGESQALFTRQDHL